MPMAAFATQAGTKRLADQRSPVRRIADRTGAAHRARPRPRIVTAALLDRADRPVVLFAIGAAGALP